MAKETMTKTELTRRIQEAFGADLVAVVRYGSTVGLETTGSQPRQNILVLVQTLTPGSLRAVSRGVRDWVRAGHPVPLILTAAEWRASHDVFAIEVADILARHEVLAGTLPIEATGVDAADLRHQLEFEARGKLLTLRQGILAADGDPAQELQLLSASRSGVLVLFRTLLRLHGEAVPADAAEVVRRAATRAGFDPAPFLAVVAHDAGIARIPKGQADAVLTGYHGGVEAFVAYVDAGSSVP